MSRRGGGAGPSRRGRPRRAVLALTLGLGAAACAGAARPGAAPAPASVADVRVHDAAAGHVDAGWHRGIVATVFWVGEGASEDNGGIANLASAWDDDWTEHFGGVDDPVDRRGLLPPFAPRENPFYVALPYNDLDDDGSPRAGAHEVVPWSSAPAAGGRSMLKNRWVEVRAGARVAYAQWQDVGPFVEDDAAYVFGTAAPRTTTGVRAGIDLSPAVRDALGAGDVSQVDWRFVEAAEVPTGPWTAVVTNSPVSWR